MAASSKGLNNLSSFQEMEKALDLLQSRDGRISDLPDELLIHILFFLPSKTAVTTSLLSKRWKNLWTSCPNWEFELQQSPAEAVESVNQFLRFHSLPKIKRFRLSFNISSYYQRCHFTEVENWIDLAGKKGVEEIDLNLGSQVRYHHFFYHAISFTSIKPLTSLKTLSLTKITISHNLIQTLILECHLLEILDFTMCTFLASKLGISAHDIRLRDLKLDDCIDLDEIEICCPKLVSFNYNGRPVKFQFKNNPCLTYAVFGFDKYYKDYVFAYVYIRFAPSLQFLLDHSDLRSLTLNTSLIKTIQENEYRCPCFCGSSKPMALQVEGGDEIVFISGVMHFLKKFTQLEKISIDLGIVHVDMMKPYDYEQVVFHHLKTIKLKLGCGRHERWLVKFLLEKAVVLETMSLSISSSAPWFRRREVELQYRQLQGEILRFPRASSCSKIVFM